MKWSLAPMSLALLWLLPMHPMAAENTQQEAIVAKVFPITVVQPQRETLQITSSVVGSLQAKNQPKVAAEVAGRVIQISVEVGDRVQKNQLLARIDDEDYQLAKAAAQAEIQRLNALLPAQKMQVERLTQLVQSRTTSQDKLDQAQAEWGATQALLEGAKVRLAQAERKIQLCRIKSPITGLVNARMIAKGDFVNTGTPMVQLVDHQDLEAVLPFPEAMAAKITLGQKIYLSTLMHPEKILQVKVDRLRPLISHQSLGVLADVNNTLNWPLGISLNATLVLDEQPNSLMIPQAAMVLRNGQPVVFVIENNRVKAQPISPGLVKNGQVQVLAGLQGQELLALKGAAFLSDGSAVEVK